MLEVAGMRKTREQGSGYSKTFSRRRTDEADNRKALQDPQEGLHVIVNREGMRVPV